MKKAVLIFALVMIVAGQVGAQVAITNPYNEEVELGNRQGVTILRPKETKNVTFLSGGSRTENVRIRIKTGGGYNSEMVNLVIVDSKATIVKGTPRASARASARTAEKKSEKPISSSSQSSTVGASPKVPEVTGTATVKPFNLVLTNSSEYSILVFEGDFYGAALASGKSTEPSSTTPGMISLKLLYDGDPPETSTGKNMWQVPISGLVTQNQDTFYIRNEHLLNVQRHVRKVVFYNPTKYDMVSDNLKFDIEPIAPGCYSGTIKMNTGFNNMSFSYMNEAGVKVRAVFEMVVTSKGTPVIRLELNPLGGGYGVIK